MMFVNVTSEGKVLTSSDGRVQGFINDEMKGILEFTNEGIMCCVIGMFGMSANLINMAVFFKQGLNNTINISLFGLSFSDFMAVSSLVYVGITKNPIFWESDVVIMPTEFSYLTGAWPHGCFATITCWHTVYATAERCLCIAIPLKCKQIITPRRTTTILCVIYLVTIATMVPQYASAYIDWKFFQDKNRTLLGLVFTEDRKFLDGLSFLLHTLFGLLSFAAVIFFTAILVVKLNQRTKWRKKSASEIDQSEGISDKDRKTILMILLIATVLIICYFPGISFGALTFIESEFSGTGRYSNEFFAAWSFANIFESVNSSVNIIFYCKMSSRYRATLVSMLSQTRRIQNKTDAMVTRKTIK